MEERFNGIYWKTDERCKDMRLAKPRPPADVGRDELHQGWCLKFFVEFADGRGCLKRCEDSIVVSDGGVKEVAGWKGACKMDDYFVG